MRLLRRHLIVGFGCTARTLKEFSTTHREASQVPRIPRNVTPKIKVVSADLFGRFLILRTWKMSLRLAWQTIPTKPPKDINYTAQRVSSRVQYSVFSGNFRLNPLFLIEDLQASSLILRYSSRSRYLDSMSLRSGAKQKLTWIIAS